MKLVDCVRRFPERVGFRRTSGHSDSVSELEFEPLSGKTLTDTDGFFVLKAKHVIGPNKISDCYIDMSMPERISDYAYFFADGRCGLTPIYETTGKVIPAVAIEGFGAYEQYYCESDAEIGLSVLRAGLAVAKTKRPIALDMGYILRDEERVEEAIEAFSIAIREGASSDYYTYSERARLYEKLGRFAEAQQDRSSAQLLR